METAEQPDFDQLGALARMAQQGDQAAYESLLEQLYTYVRRVLFSRLGNISELDDLTQICLLAMHRALPTYHPSRNLGPWVRAIIRYKIADHFRAQARRREFAQDQEMLDLASAHNDGGTGLVDQVNVHELMKQLPSTWAEAVRLTKFEGFSCEDAAKKQGVSSSALRKRVSRAYRKLADLIEMEIES